MTTNTTHRASTTRSSSVATAMAALLLFSASLKASELDEGIVAAAQASYVFKTFLVDDALVASSLNGVVTLTGTVTDESHKMLAGDTIENLPGVKSVDNKIVVKDNPPERSDTWLYMKVKSALAFHRSVNAYKTKVELKEGIVILTGVASSQAQKELTGEYAKDVDGVKEVRNDMTIAVATVPETTERTIEQTIDDASITAQVRMALWTHRSTSPLKTRVKTREGVVTLDGSVANTAESDLVTKLANDVTGVKSVINSMVIVPVTTTK